MFLNPYWHMTRFFDWIQILFEINFFMVWGRYLRRTIRSVTLDISCCSLFVLWNDLSNLQCIKEMSKFITNIYILCRRRSFLFKLNNLFRISPRPLEFLFFLFRIKLGCSRKSSFVVHDDDKWLVKCPSSMSFRDFQHL